MSKDASRAGASPAPSPVWRMMVILVVLYAVAFLDRSVISMIGPDLRAHLHLSVTELALLQGLGFLLFYTTAGLPIGALVDRMSRRAIIFVGVIVWSLSASAGGLTGSFGALLLTRFGVGAGEAALTPSAYSMITDSVPRERRALMASIFNSGAALGAAISVLFGGILMGWAVVQPRIVLPQIGAVRPWQFVLIALGLPGLLLAGTIFLIPEPVRKDRIGDGKIGFRHVAAFVGARRRYFICCFGGFALVQSSLQSFGLWIPTRLVQEFHWTYGQVGALLATSSILAVAGGWMIGLVADRLTRTTGDNAAPLTVAAICTVISGVGVVVAFTATSPLIFSIFACVATVPSITLGLGLTATQNIAPNEYRGRLIALFTMVTSLLGAGLGPLLPALLTDHVFRNDASINISVAIIAGVITPIAAGLLLAARVPMRRAYAAGAAWRDTE